MRAAQFTAIHTPAAICPDLLLAKESHLPRICSGISCSEQQAVILWDIPDIATYKPPLGRQNNHVVERVFFQHDVSPTDFLMIRILGWA